MVRFSRLCKSRKRHHPISPNQQRIIAFFPLALVPTPPPSIPATATFSSLTPSPSPFPSPSRSTSSTSTSTSTSQSYSSHILSSSLSLSTSTSTSISLYPSPSPSASVPLFLSFPLKRAPLYHRRKAYKEYLMKRDGKLPEVYGWYKTYMMVAVNNFSDYSVRTIERMTIHGIDYPRDTRVAVGEVDEMNILVNIEVEVAFRRRGLGTELIRYMNAKLCHTHANGYHDYRLTAIMNIPEKSTYQVTAEGLGLLQRCVALGILDDEQLITPTTSAQGQSPHRTP